MEATVETRAIGEAARELELSVDTLRYYERAGLLDGVLRTEGNQRRYGPEAIAALHFVTKMRASGMPIRTIRRYMALMREGEAAAGARRLLLEEHRAAVQARMDELSGYLEIIDMKIDLYARNVDPKSDDPCARKLAQRMTAKGEKP